VFDANQLAAALLADDSAVDQAVARASAALAAWRAFPGFIRDAYPLEANRLARRTAAAILELVQLVEVDGQEVAQ
jgi:acyl-CoA reductase-like NAD-dependent aldehyde dehydrogenase